MDGGKLRKERGKRGEIMDGEKRKAEKRNRGKDGGMKDQMGEEKYKNKE